VLSLEKLGIDFGNRWLFRGVNYQFHDGEMIGLIGRNGTGKSTLLKIIMGEMSASEGFVHKSRGLKIAHFHQELLSFETQKPIMEVAREAYAHLLKMKVEIEQLTAEVEAGSTDSNVWDQLMAKQKAFEAQGGKHIDASVHEMLSGLGFPEHRHYEPYHTFSGGWRMRVLLAKMLLSKPDILLLDEPTNHLDLPSIQWLEGYLKGFRGCCVVVSHDRYFLDRIANKILEISREELTVYSGNYTYYLSEKALRIEQQKREYENQQRYIAEQERFINRFRAKASKARQVQSKIKMLDKLERIKAPEEDHIDLQINFKVRQKPGKEIIGLKNIDKAYGDNVVLSGAEGTVMRGDKIALIGANGTGKSTLLRVVAGTEPFVGGRKLGHNVEDSFFAQHQLEALTPDNTILDELIGVSIDKTETEIRGILGSFMFSGEDVNKRIKVLSGGEKSRVALAKVLVSEANFLLLDEPTNHLDIASIEILVQALNSFEGTFVVVSHDRFFLSKIANTIWYIEEQKVKQYPGTYEEYEYWKAKKAAEAEGIMKEALQKKQKEVSQKEQSKGKVDYKRQKQIKNRIRKLEREEEKLEDALMEKEGEKETLELSMGNPEIAADFEKLSQVQKQIEGIDQEIDALTEQWEEISMEIEELKEEQD